MPFPTLPPLQPEALRRLVAALRRLLDAAQAQAGEGAAVAEALGALLHTSGFTAPFDWQAWLAEAADGRPTGDWAADPEVVAAAGLETLRRLATVHLRTARYVDGHLEALLASGYVRRLAERLAGLAERDDA